MRSSLVKFSVIGTAIWSALIVSLATGCASGGFKLTREYAGFVNRQNIILRIVLYIFTSVVFAVTMIIDLVVFNTMDFWQGRLSQGTYEFSQGGKTYVAHHKRDSITGLRESRIVITGKNVNQEVMLRELADQKIEVLIDGVLRGRVSDISELPRISYYDTKGELISSKMIPFEEHSVAVAR